MKTIKPFYLVLIINLLIMVLYFLPDFWLLFFPHIVINGILFIILLFFEKYRTLSLAFLLSAFLSMIVGFSACMVLLTTN